MPYRFHHVLPTSTTRGRRVLIVGDIHGCHAELQALLAKCDYRPGEDVLLLVGDLVNKGPMSKQVRSTEEAADAGCSICVGWCTCALVCCCCPACLAAQPAVMPTPIPKHYVFPWV